MDAHIVAVYKGNPCFFSLCAKKFVAFFVFAQAVGGAGKVKENICTIIRQGLGNIKVVVFCPTVFANHQANFNFFTTNGKLQRLECFCDYSVFFSAQFLQAVEVAVIVKLTIVGQGVFNNKVASHITANDFAILAGKGSVVFTQASVFVELVFFKGNITKHNAQVSRSFYDFFCIILAVIKEGLLFPQVTNEVTGDTHFREQ